MPQLIKPNDVKILTKDGEIKVSITLDLNINMQPGYAGFDKKEEKHIMSEIDDKTQWQIPDFNSEEKINFGKEKK